MGVTAIAAVMNGRRRRKSARTSGGSYSSRYRQTMALLNRSGSATTSGGAMKKKRRGARKKARRNPYGVRRIGDISKPRKKTRKLAKRTTRAVRAPKRRKARAKQPKTGRRYGPFKSLKAKIGIQTKSTYLYAKRGKAHKIPLWAILKTKSKRDLESRVGSDDRLARRVVAAKKKRERAAARVMAHGDAFTPNRRRMKVIPYETWSASMEPNKRGRKKRAKKRGRKASHRRKAARRPKARGGARKAHRRTRKKRAGTRRRKSSGRRRKAHANPARRTRRRRKARRNAWFDDHAGHVKAGKKGSRRRKAKRRRKSSHRRKSAHRRKHMMMNLGAAPAATPNRRHRRRGKRRHHANAHYMANRRHHARRHHRGHHRSYRRNPDFMGQLKEALKFGAVVGVGFIGHKIASRLISEMALSKISAFQTGSLSAYRPLIGGLLAALVGVPLAAKFGGENGKKIAAGVGTSLLQTAVVSVLNAVGQSGPAGYLAGYPDNQGRAYTGYGEYFEPPGMSGYGAYEMEPSYNGFGAGPMITQAAAGYGAPPMITQAAAGYGEITQAAAGVGEFFMAGVEGIGDYEQAGQGLAYSAAPDEGIYPDLTSAERALNIAEAAAGVGGYGDIPEQSIVSHWTQMKGFGDLPFKSIVEPTGVAVGVQDAPMGARAGILEGGDGIFG